MKKIILSILAVFVFGFSNAQKTKFGIKGGMNIANQVFSGDGAPVPSSIVGVNVGAFVEVKIAPKLFLQPEVLFSSQGSSFKISLTDFGLDEDVEATFKLSYINVPVLFKYYAAEKFSLEAGPQIGFLQNSKAEVKVSGQSNSENTNSEFKTVDFGFNLGAGYDFTKQLSAGVRYNLGLSNIAKTDSGDNTVIKNSVLSISLSYKFK